MAMLEEDLERERSTVTNLNRMIRTVEPSTASPAPRIEREKIPDQEKYEGDRDGLPEFLLQLRLKAPTLRDDQARLWYAISLLKGGALAPIRPFVSTDRVSLNNLEELITKLEAAFGDPDKDATAEKKLLSLKQTNKDFPTFYAEFSRYATDTDWDNNAKRSLMRNALYYELKADLVGQVEPADFDEWVALLQRLDIRRRQLTAEGSRRLAPSSNAGTTAKTGAAAAPRATATAATSAAASPSTVTGTAPGPMDLSSGRKILTLEERKKRMDEGRCMYCGGLGHMARNCPNARHPLRVAEATIGDTTDGVETAPAVPLN